MKNNIKILKNISDIKWWKFWVEESLFFSEIERIKSNGKSSNEATKQKSLSYKNLLQKAISYNISLNDMLNLSKYNE
ncbi:MAG TPA: hypothetical protein PKX92_09290 [Edaphocola sp.]|nr:hypothetical protein [Edaphocola sp.]